MIWVQVDPEIVSSDAEWKKCKKDQQQLMVWMSSQL